MKFEKDDKEQAANGPEAGKESELSYEELRERWRDLHEENAALTAQVEREMAEEFGDLESFNEKMEKDPVAQKMMEGLSPETSPTQRRQQIEGAKIPMLNMFGDAARLRKFLLQNETLKKLGAVQEEWRRVGDRLSVMEKMQQQG